VKIDELHGRCVARRISSNCAHFTCRRRRRRRRRARSRMFAGLGRTARASTRCSASSARRARTGPPSTRQAFPFLVT
jgi:hypothetical protein